VQLCGAGSALLVVNNPGSSMIYHLYNNPTNIQPLDTQQSGVFNVVVTGNTNYYISQSSGNCESPRAQVNVTVGLSALNIANAFTPNGDGINDYWKINGIENYPGAIVRVFTRYGQKVFDSKGYSKPFDGTVDGENLPVGVYYYIINLNTNCNLLSGSLTIIR
jgi:gliding motility-associated-like protein